MLLVGCNDFAAADPIEPGPAPQELVFSNLSWPSAFIVELSEDGRATWRTGIDAGGSGYMCPIDSEFYCLMLEGAWKFAIRRQLVSNPQIGAKWGLDGVEFELIEIVRLRAKLDDEQSLVVSAQDRTVHTIFNFSASQGIQFISTGLGLSDENPDEIYSSVWINTALIEVRE